MTTTIIKTIGVGGPANGYDYADFNAASAAMPASLVTADEAWILEVSGAHGELVFTDVQSILNTVDATRTIKIRAKAGTGFASNSSKLTSALTYNPSNGTAIRTSGGNWNTAFVLTSVSSIEGLQIKGTHDSPTTLIVLSGTISGCIIDAALGGYTVGIIECQNIYNSLVVQRGGVGYSNNIVKLYGTVDSSTFISYGSGANTIYSPWNAVVARNCVFIGQAAVFYNDGGGGTLAATYCATTSPTLSGTGNTAGATSASMLVGPLSGSLDARAKSGGPLVSAGTRSQSATQDLDIVQTARSTTAPTIGAWEFSAAVDSAPTITAQPQNATVVAGGTATFNVTATGSPAPTYQWQRNGTNISGAASSSYTTPSTTVSGGSANNGDLYACIVTNILGSVTSNSATLYVSASGDSQPPQLTGTITVTSITQTGYTLTWPLATDNIGVTANEYSTNGGTSYTSVGLANTVNVTGRSQGTTDAVRVRARDAAGNYSTPVLSTSVTLLSAPLVSFSTPSIKNNTGTILANISEWSVNVYNASTGVLVVQKTGLTTNGSGILTVSDNSMTATNTYSYEAVHATYGRRLPVATAA